MWTGSSFVLILFFRKDSEWNQALTSPLVRLLSRIWLFATPGLGLQRGLLHARLPCLSLSPGACSNSCPLSKWCHPIILSSVVPFSSCLQSFPASGSFPISSSHQVAQVLELQLQHQSFQWIFRVDFFYDWLVWSPCCPRDSQQSSPAL